MKFNHRLFLVDLREKKERFALREIQSETGINYQTINRILAGDEPKIKNWLTLCDWMKVKPQKYLSK